MLLCFLFEPLNCKQIFLRLQPISHRPSYYKFIGARRHELNYLVFVCNVDNFPLALEEDIQRDVALLYIAITRAVERLYLT